MKKYDPLKMLFLFILVFPFVAYGQDMPKTKFILPDGKEISPDKLDSVKKAWNGERILFQHNKEDDKKQVMHLVRMTPEMAKMLEELAEKRQQAMLAMTGKAAPDFSIKDRTGKTWTLSQLKGKVVILNFWFTSCPPCIQEMPQLNNLVKKYSNKSVIFLGLTFNDKRTVDAFLKEHIFNYTLLPSSKEVDKMYQVSSWPTSFVISKEGKIKAAMNASENVFSEISDLIEQELD